MSPINRQRVVLGKRRRYIRHVSHFRRYGAVSLDNPLLVDETCTWQTQQQLSYCSPFTSLSAMRRLLQTNIRRNCTTVHAVATLRRNQPVLLRENKKDTKSHTPHLQAPTRSWMGCIRCIPLPYRASPHIHHLDSSIYSYSISSCGRW